MPSLVQEHKKNRASRFGLNAANFFQAEAVGGVLPVLNGYLCGALWFQLRVPETKDQLQSEAVPQPAAV